MPAARARRFSNSRASSSWAPRLQQPALQPQRLFGILDGGGQRRVEQLVGLGGVPALARQAVKPQQDLRQRQGRGGVRVRRRVLAGLHEQRAVGALGAFEIARRLGHLGQLGEDRGVRAVHRRRLLELGERELVVALGAGDLGQPLVQVGALARARASPPARPAARAGRAPRRGGRSGRARRPAPVRAPRAAARGRQPSPARGPRVRAGRGARRSPRPRYARAIVSAASSLWSQPSASTRASGSQASRVAVEVRQHRAQLIGAREFGRARARAARWRGGAAGRHVGGRQPGRDLVARVAFGHRQAPIEPFGRRDRLAGRERQASERVERLGLRRPVGPRSATRSSRGPRPERALDEARRSAHSAAAGTGCRPLPGCAPGPRGCPPARPGGSCPRGPPSACAASGRAPAARPGWPAARRARCSAARAARPGGQSRGAARAGAPDPRRRSQLGDAQARRRRRSGPRPRTGAPAPRARSRPRAPARGSSRQIRMAPAAVVERAFGQLGGPPQPAPAPLVGHAQARAVEEQRRRACRPLGRPRGDVHADGLVDRMGGGVGGAEPAARARVARQQVAGVRVEPAEQIDRQRLVTERARGDRPPASCR